MDKLGVKHVLLSSYNPQSNGAAERVCKSIHELLEKRGGKRTHQMELGELCFKVNSIVQPGGRGSAAERFLKRSPKTFLPGTMRDHIDHVEMVKKRHEHQVSLSLKKGSTSFDEFLPGGRVVIQDNSSGKWLEEGVIDQEKIIRQMQPYQMQMQPLQPLQVPDLAAPVAQPAYRSQYRPASISEPEAMEDSMEKYRT